MYTGGGPVDGLLCPVCDADHAVELELVDEEQRARDIQDDREEEEALDRWRGIE